jgi:hypothetical protein
LFIIYQNLIVTSITIPNATLNTNTDAGVNLIPNQPIKPAVSNKGIILGINEHNKILKDLNKYNMQSAINKNAYNTLSFKPAIIKLLPSKKVILVPVKLFYKMMYQNFAGFMF